MAKPLSPKSVLIREAIQANSDLGNKELAELINGSDAREEDKIEVKPQDIAQQKQAMKKAGEAVPLAEANGRGKKRGRPPAAVAATPTAVALAPARKPAAAPQGGVASHVEAIKKAVEELGAAEVRKLTGLFE